MGLRADPGHYTLGGPMSSLLGRAFPALRPASARLPGPLDGFVDSLVQKLENCRTNMPLGTTWRRPGLTDDLLAKGPSEVEAWADSLYAEEVPRLRDAIRTEEPHLTREAFQDYWLNTHAPLVRSVAATLRIRRYVQLHSFDPEISMGTRASRGGPEQYDGVAELWWDSFEDMAASGEAAAEAGRLLLEDEKRFIDLSRSPLWWGEEKTIIG